MRGFGPLWASDPGSRHVSTVGGMTPAGDDLLRYAEEVNARLLVVDPAGLAICTNENDRALVSLALDAFAGWATRTGCAVLLVGHPKASEGEAASYSGSTAWRGCVRALWTLRQPGDQQVDRGSAEWRGIVGRDPDRQERVALLSRNKNNYGRDGDHLTVTTRGGRAGWYLTDSLPAPARQIGKKTAAANGTGTVPVGRPGAVPGQCPPEWWRHDAQPSCPEARRRRPGSADRVRRRRRERGANRPAAYLADSRHRAR